MNYIISYPRSGSTMTRYIFELITKKPTNGLCGVPNSKDNLQQPLLHDGDDYCLHKRHDFKGVTDFDFVLFVIRNPFEATIRHNEKPRGITKDQMKGYLDSWFDLLNQYDKFTGNKMCLYYDEVQKIASKESLQIYRNAESKGEFWHRAKLTTEVYQELLDYIQNKYQYLYNKYL